MKHLVLRRASSPSSNVTKERLGALAPDGKHFIASLAMGQTLVSLDTDFSPIVQLYMLPGAFSHVEMYENKDPSSGSSFVLDTSADMRPTPNGGAVVTERSAIAHRPSPDVEVYTCDSLGRITDCTEEDGSTGHAEGSSITYTPAPAGAPRFVRFSSMCSPGDRSDIWSPGGGRSEWTEESDGQWTLAYRTDYLARQQIIEYYSPILTFDAYGRPVKTEESGSVVSAWTYTGYGDAVVNFDTASSAFKKFEYDTSTKTLSQYSVWEGTEKLVETLRYDENGYVLELDYYDSGALKAIRVAHTTF